MQFHLVPTWVPLGVQRLYGFKRVTPEHDEKVQGKAPGGHGAPGVDT